MVAGHVEREPHRRRQRRLGAARLARPQALDLEPQLAPEGELALQRLGLVAIARHEQRAARAKADVLAQLVAEVTEAACGAQPELDRRGVADLRLGDRCEHPGGDLPGARVAGVEHDRAQTATGRAPGAGEADRPAARYGEVIRAGGHCLTFPPYAGTTRIRFDGRRPTAALSARLVEGSRSAYMVAP